MSGSTTDGFSAWVSINGVKLPQYGVETRTIKGVKTVTCWIASEVDKVGWSVPAYPEQLSGDVYIDGIDAGGYFHAKLDEPDTATQSVKYVSDTVARPLMFSRTEFTDEDAYIGVNPSGLGEITVEIWVTKLDPQSKAQDYDPREQPTKIHERMKKAISHRATFGEEFQITEPAGVVTCSDERHLISFVFKYRPRDYLQAEGIISLDPKTIVRSRKRAAEILELGASEDEDNAEELRLRQEELQVQKERLEVQKREMRMEKREMQMEKREMQIQKEELRMRAEELKLQRDAIKAGKAKTQRKKVKSEYREATLQVKAETIDLT